MPSRTSLLLSFLVLATHTFAAATSGTAFTGRYWDCCKPSCGWKDKADFNNPVTSCDKNNNPLDNYDAGTGCNTGGTAYTCSDQSPWAINDTFAYGFVGAYIKGGGESTWCCACYQLDFLEGALKGKTMVVQASNTDYDMPNENVFTFNMPGGNNSYSGCAAQYGLSTDVFGSNVTGVSSRSDCDDLPEGQREGCRFRFDWFENADSPKVNFTRVTCPAVLTSITGCIRDDDSNPSSFSTSFATLAASPGKPLYLSAISALVLLAPWLLS